jgi:nicotinamide-nucleotide adenylyltransferase
MYKTALFIGRFQPFHKGHLFILDKCLALAERVVVLVAKSEAVGQQNDPWGVVARKRMVCEVVRAQRVDERIARIVSCPDYPSDAKWLREVKKRAGQFDVVVSNNEWTLRVFREAGYATVESGLHNREELEGLKIRELMRGGRDEWKERVPEEVVRLFENNEIEMIRSIY